MKKSSWIDQLSKSTKTTVIVCGSLLVLSAAITLFLLFFPIQKEDQPTVVVEPVRHTEYSTTTAVTTAPESTTSHGPHTLSTWNAGINGYSRSLDEFKETEDPSSTTTDPRLWRETTTASSTAASNLSTSDAPPLSSVTTDMPQTVTTTVDEEEMTAPSLPDLTEPEDNEDLG